MGRKTVRHTDRQIARRPDLRDHWVKVSLAAVLEPSGQLEVLSSLTVVGSAVDQPFCVDDRACCKSVSCARKWNWFTLHVKDATLRKMCTSFASSVIVQHSEYRSNAFCPWVRSRVIDLVRPGSRRSDPA